MSSLDRLALRQGATTALVFAVPFSIGASIAGKGSSWALPLALCALVGFFLGAGIAAWQQTKDLPLLHGLVCAGGTYLAAQAVFIVIKLFRGGDVNWLGAFFTFTAVLFTGLVGGGLGGMMRRRGILPGQRGPR
ncbi:MAG: hypothetical protein ACOYMR_13710 [Ilumatobacteraceae bacterium]